ncbi:hypothetical protein PQG02_32185 (plasmid) [Nostoc sp. UHCC 0926]|uniref:hypothetical protein n=1 Tax=Nostoc sp. UHCC 0926 TaxID=3025190 RepID=UPI00235F06CD|nr:hypothetical protein [Nostoc sp. UHCC 0926]WDD36061.1 hypothetical protein PQG02_32185 [Nostoc sp. UHCC 0926]
MYSTEVLDEMTKLVFMVKYELGCSFDEACATTRIILQKVKKKEIVVDSSLKSSLPNFLEQVRSSNFS